MGAAASARRRHERQLQDAKLERSRRCVRSRYIVNGRSTCLSVPRRLQAAARRRKSAVQEALLHTIQHIEPSPQKRAIDDHYESRERMKQEEKAISLIRRAVVRKIMLRRVRQLVHESRQAKLSDLQARVDSTIHDIVDIGTTRSRIASTIRPRSAAHSWTDSGVTDWKYPRPHSADTQSIHRSKKIVSSRASRRQKQLTVLYG